MQVSLTLAQNSCDIYAWNHMAGVYQPFLKSKDYVASLDSLLLNKFFALQVDSIYQKSEACRLYVHLGNVYNQSYIHLQEQDSIYAINDYISSLKDSLNRHNHPFSKIILTPNGFINNKPIYQLKVGLDSARHINAIKWVGYKPRPKGFIQQMIPEKATIASSIELIENKIKSSSAIRLKYPSKVSYTTDSTILYVYTQKIRQNSFDGMIGFSNDENQVRLNGQVNINLKNAFNLLEQIDFNWTSENNQSQSLNFNTHFPYVFLKNFGTTTQLKIRKQDSTFLQLHIALGLTYQINEKLYVGGSYHIETSNYIESIVGLGQDYKKRGFGVEYHYIDDQMLLFQGNKTQMHAHTHLMLHDENRTRQTTIGYEAYHQHKIFKNQYAFIQLQGENMIQKNHAFLRNELFQLGGMNNLRGFNQNSIFTPAYNIATLSYRYIPSNNFLIELFTDLAYIQNFDNDNFEPYHAVGTGMHLRTKVGVFRLMYALGKNKPQAFNFAAGRIHFGIATSF